MSGDRTWQVGDRITGDEARAALPDGAVLTFVRAVVYTSTYVHVDTDPPLVRTVGALLPGMRPEHRGIVGHATYRIDSLPDGARPRHLPVSTLPRPHTACPTCGTPPRRCPVAYKLTDGFCGAGGSSQGAAAVDTVVYVLLVNDRHHDPDPAVYTASAAAVADAERERAARGWVLDDLTPAMAADGWLYAASHPTESDTLQVVERKVTR